MIITHWHITPYRTLKVLMLCSTLSVIFGGCYNDRYTTDSFIVNNERTSDTDPLIDFFVVSPNPIRSKAAVQWQAGRPTTINISVRSEDWRLVATLFQDTINPGEYVVDFATEKIPPGVYYIVLTAESGTHVIPVIVIH